MAGSKHFMVNNLSKSYIDLYSGSKEKLQQYLGCSCVTTFCELFSTRIAKRSAVFNLIVKISCLRRIVCKFRKIIKKFENLIKIITSNKYESK